MITTYEEAQMQDLFHLNDKLRGQIHVLGYGREFFVVSLTGVPGAPVEALGGPFEFEWAAGQFLEWLIANALKDDCYPHGAYGSGGMCEAFDTQARVLAFLEDHSEPSDLKKLARDFVDDEPWRKSDDWRESDAESIRF